MERKKLGFAVWVSAGVLAFLLVLPSLLFPLHSLAQSNNPWSTIKGQYCFESWIIEAMYRLNAYTGSQDFNARKPWRINRYGMLEGNPKYWPRPGALPDDYGRYNNKYWWMWDHYLRDPVSGWSWSEWNEAGIPPLQDFVLGCIGEAGGAIYSSPRPSSPSMPPIPPSMVPPPSAVSPPSVLPSPLPQPPPGGPGIAVPPVTTAKPATPMPPSPPPIAALPPSPAPPVAPPQPSSTSAAGSAPEIGQPLRSETEAYSDIKVETGGTIQLANTAALTIPPGALSQDTTVKFRKLDTAAVDVGKSFALYEVTGIPGALKEPAILTLPFGSVPSDYQSPDVQVKVFDPQKGWVNLPITVDAAAKRVTARADHCSPIEVSWGGPYKAIADQLITSPSPPLPVPYYPQLNSPWCFAAASQMLLKFYDKDVEIWEIAHFFNLNTEHGSETSNLYKGQYKGLFARYGLNIQDGTTGYWRRFDSLKGFLMGQLHKNRPVLVALYYGRHAVVVTGYDREGIWIHDPQGVAIGWAEGKTPEQVDGLKNQLSQAKLSWELWEKAVHGLGVSPFAVDARTLFDPILDPLAYTIVVTDAAPANVLPATITVGSPRERKGQEAAFNQQNDFSLFHIDPDTGVERNVFTWDGTQPKGYKFATKAFDAPNLLTNSDLLEQLNLSANNGDPYQAYAATVKAFIDTGKDTREMIQKNVLLPANTSQLQLSLWDPGNPLRFNKLAKPFPPGDHVLRLELAVNGKPKPVDLISISFTLRPAQVQNVRVVYSKEDRSANVTWDKNIDDVYGLEYVVLMNRKEVGSTRGYEQWIEIPENGLPDIRVVARTLDRKLVSFLSEKASLTPLAPTGRDYTSRRRSLIPRPFNLTGRWTGSDGRTYDLRHVGNQLEWRSQSGAGGKTKANLFQGRIEGNLIIGRWENISQGRVQDGGKMTLQLLSPNYLRAVALTGGFAGSEWTRP